MSDKDKDPYRDTFFDNLNRAGTLWSNRDAIPGMSAHDEKYNTATTKSSSSPDYSYGSGDYSGGNSTDSSSSSGCLMLVGVVAVVLIIGALIFGSEAVFGFVALLFVLYIIGLAN